MIVDILTIIAIYIGIVWSIYMSLIFRREYKKLKKEAVKKVDEIVDKAQEVSKEMKYSILGLASLAAMAIFVGSLLLNKLTPE